MMDADASRVSSGDGASIESAPGSADGCSREDDFAASSDSYAADSDGPAAATDRSLAMVPAQPLLPVCEGFSLRVTDATVELVGTDAAMLLEEAEEIEDLKVCHECVCMLSDSMM